MNELREKKPQNVTLVVVAGERRQRDSSYLI
jgi:hypothetical protein